MTKNMNAISNITITITSTSSISLDFLSYS